MNENVKETFSFIKHFKHFHFIFGHYEEILPRSNQPGQLYGTTKTRKFTNTDEITIDNLKFRPLIAQTGTYTYNAVQVIAKHLKPQWK